MLGRNLIYLHAPCQEQSSDAFCHSVTGLCDDTGPTFAMVFQKVSQGVPIQDASIEVNKALNGKTAGCAPAHRIAPLASFKKIPTNKLVDYAKQEALITHYHPDAGNCSGVMVLLCRHLLEGHSWTDSKELVRNNNMTKDIWDKIQNANLNNGGYVLDVMHSALYFLNGNDSIKRSLQFAHFALLKPHNVCSIFLLKSRYANRANFNAKT